MPNPFSVHRSTTPSGATALRLDGFLDAYTAPQFEKAIQGELDAGVIRLIADGTKLTYISSAGLGVFMGFIEEIREQKGDIKICGLSPKVYQVFEMLGFAELYDIVEDIAAADALFAAGSLREAWS